MERKMPGAGAVEVGLRGKEPGESACWAATPLAMGADGGPS